jgi:hypothetical protein
VCGGFENAPGKIPGRRDGRGGRGGGHWVGVSMN